MALFDSKADTYDEFCKTPLGHFVNEVERSVIAAVALPRVGEHAIDLGCGTGVSTVWLQKLGLRVVGVDVSQGMLDVAMRNHGNSDGFIQADLHQLPFADASFDLAFANVVLEFVSEPRRVMEEARRVLKPGGRLVVGFIGANSPWGKKYLMRGIADPSSVYHHAKFFTYADAARLGWNQPSLSKFGLYVGPDDFTDEPSAREREFLRNAAHKEDAAGFFALRWDKA